MSHGTQRWKTFPDTYIPSTQYPLRTSIEITIPTQARYRCGAFIFGAFVVALCLRGFSPGILASSHSPKTCASDGVETVNCPSVNVCVPWWTVNCPGRTPASRLTTLGNDARV